MHLLVIKSNILVNGITGKKEMTFSRENHLMVFTSNILVNGKTGKKEMTFSRENAFNSI